MRPLQVLAIIISLNFHSCKSSPANTERKDTVAKDSISPTPTVSVTQSIPSALDTFPHFEVDDYPVTDVMLADARRNNYKLQSGELLSYDKVWFRNDTLNEILVFELYTDYHRLITFHFQNNAIPPGIIARMELHVAGGDTASPRQKSEGFSGFIPQATTINSSYFVSFKGFKIGDARQKAIETYGAPDTQSKQNGIEKLEWKYIGEKFYNGKSDLKGKPLASDSYGHQVTMFFKNGKLIGQVLHNDIP